MRSPIHPHIDWTAEPDHSGLIQAYNELKVDPVKALVRFRQQAEKASPAAMLWLGWAYKTGMAGLAIDQSEAERWFRRAAETGSVRGYYRLGRIYLDEKRYDEAKAAFEFGAAKDFMPSLHQLGAMYYAGRGVKADFAKARPLLERATQLGSVYAKAILAKELIQGHYGRHGVLAALRGLLLRLGAYVDAFIIAYTDPDPASSDRLG